MRCPVCGSDESRIVDTDKSLGWAVLRIRRCLKCGTAYHTKETQYARVMPPEENLNNYRT